MRRELRIDLDAPLDPWRLAEHLGVPVWPASNLRGAVADKDLDRLLHVEPGAWSAVTVFRGRRRSIVHNDGHAHGRQANNIAHELSHALLLHEPAPAFSVVGCRDWDTSLESEAAWLGGALLISDEAALRIVKDGLTIEEAAVVYGVSEPLVRWRVNVTGAKKRALGSVPKGLVKGIGTPVHRTAGQREA